MRSDGKSHTDQIGESRQELLTHLATGNNECGRLTYHIALDIDAPQSLVVAAMWQLVDEGLINFAAGAKISLVTSPSPHEEP